MTFWKPEYGPWHQETKDEWASRHCGLYDAVLLDVQGLMILSFVAERCSHEILQLPGYSTQEKMSLADAFL